MLKKSGLKLDSFQQEDISVTLPLADGNCDAKARCHVLNMKGNKMAEQNVFVHLGILNQQEENSALMKTIKSIQESDD